MTGYRKVGVVLVSGADANGNSYSPRLLEDIVGAYNHELKHLRGNRIRMAYNVVASHIDEDGITVIDKAEIIALEKTPESDGAGDE